MIKNRLPVLIAALVMLGGLLTAGAQAATVSAAPAVTSEGTRLVVTFTGKRPTKASIKVNGTRHKLKRSGKRWRTKALPTDVVVAAAGKTATVKARVGKKTRRYTTTVAGGATTPGTGTPGTPPPGTPPPSSLFAAPGVDRVGNPAYEAIKGYFADHMLTDCPAGWPNCAVEQRYSVFADGTHWYCRLTNSAGSDIRSVGSVAQIVGAEQKADGAWAVSFALNSYGNTVVYTVRVSASGAGTIQYWGPGVDTAGPPSEVTTGLVWVRGARDCSY